MSSTTKCMPAACPFRNIDQNLLFAISLSRLGVEATTGVTSVIGAPVLICQLSGQKGPHEN